MIVGHKDMSFVLKNNQNHKKINKYSYKINYLKELYTPGFKYCQILYIFTENLMMQDEI